MHLLSEHASRALEQTLKALKISGENPLGVAETSVFLKYLLLDILMHELDRREDLRPSLWQHREQSLAFRQRLRNLLDTPDLKSALSHVTGATLEPTAISQTLDTSTLYRERILDLVIEAVLSERMAPEICIDPVPATSAKLDEKLEGQWNHAVVFAASPLFTHELYPLAVDAFERDSNKYGKVYFNILGVHVDWFAPDGKILRLLYLDFAKQRFCECDLEIPLVPDSAQFICMGHQEYALHSSWSNRLACPQVNPHQPAARADNKISTLEGWASLGLEVPISQRVLPGGKDLATSFAKRFAEIVVKPNQGTEGEQVTYLTSTDLTALQDALSSCWNTGDALLQERRDSVFWQDPNTGKIHTLALRLHVSFDGRHYHLESGYVQIGENSRLPAACARGGEILTFAAILPHLVYLQNGSPTTLHFSTGDWQRIYEQAQKAASLFTGLMLVGLDVVLDLDKKCKPVAVFLEANSRPAGLSHTHFLPDVGLPGISLKLWDGLEHLYEHQQVSSPVA